MAPHQQRHSQVVNTLIMQIYLRELPPGTKLPSERQLSTQMKVDRTSLRVALKQLEAMHVLDIRHGDGIYVQDYIEHAGLEFLEFLFMSDSLYPEKSIIDEYIVDEMWEFWIEFAPIILKTAAKKFSGRHMKALINLLNEEIDHINDLKKVAELEFECQEVIVKVANNTVFSLISNSLRPVRQKMLEIYTATTDQQVLLQHINFKKDLFRRQFQTLHENTETIFDEYKGNLSSLRKQTRESIFDFMPACDVPVSTPVEKKVG